MPRAKSGDRVRQDLESTVRVQAQRIESLESALEDELGRALSHLPWEIRSLLRRGPEEAEVFWEWQYKLAEELLAFAKPKPDREMNAPWYNGERAYCPLCGGSAAAVIQAANTGFAFPAGLLMHLRGDGRATQCRIMIVAQRLAKARLRMRDWWK